VVNNLADLFPMILMAALISLTAAPLFIRLAPRIGLVDEPAAAPHKRHRIPTPAVGGLVLWLSIAIASALLSSTLTTQSLTITGFGLLMLILGIVDDRIALTPVQKLAGQLAIAVLLILIGVQVRVTKIPALDITLTLLWFVGMMNAFNFVDSMDGLALGLGVIASSFFMLVTIDSGQHALAFTAAAVVGACVGLFPFNASPARLFLGDSGAQLLGYYLAALGVAYVPGGAGLPQGVSWFTPILVLGVPIFDMTLVVVSRLRRGLDLGRGSWDHTYHRLLSLGLDPTRSVLLMQLGAIVLGLIAFMALDGTVLTANILFGVLVLVGLAALYVLEWKVSLDRP
jgi:UDP-GlcNAc:undecaprenyl-phosphate GlcNAc-1-phosphate transferase